MDLGCIIPGLRSRVDTRSLVLPTAGTVVSEREVYKKGLEGMAKLEI